MKLISLVEKLKSSRHYTHLKTIMGWDRHNSELYETNSNVNS
jgi:hypothetical protein